MSNLTYFVMTFVELDLSSKNKGLMLAKFRCCKCSFNNAVNRIYMEVFLYIYIYTGVSTCRDTLNKGTTIHMCPYIGTPYIRLRLYRGTRI